MTGPLAKVTPGQPLRIPAGTYNAFVEAARNFQDRSLGNTGGTSQPAGGLVLVRNDSGADRDRFDILGVSGALLTPTENLASFQSEVALLGAAPAAGHEGRFVILAEPIAAGACGRAHATGLCPVLVSVTDADHTCAEVAAGDHAKLASGFSGSAAILYKEAGTGSKWTVVHLNGAGGGGGLPPGGSQYQVLQRNGAGAAVWDWVHAHG